ncbi:MAG: glycosyltransferase [Candidatus Woesearchaeota archaeon]
MKKLNTKKILMLGYYNPNMHSRTKNIKLGLEKLNFHVEQYIEKNPIKVVKRLLKKDYNLLFITGKKHLFLAYLLKFIHKKKILFDAFISDYDTLVNDRKLVKDKTIKAKILWLLDKISCQISDHIILDTKEHIDYFVNEFKLKKEKFSEVVIGADETIFYPRKIKKNKKFTVMFHGTFIPLQGIEYIIKSAKIIEDNKKYKNKIDFILIGKGQTFPEMKKLSETLKLKNIKFLGLINMNELPDILLKGHIILGIFGITEKAKRVIPNKAYEAIALKMPLLTGKTQAILSKFKDKENCLLANIGDEKDIAEKIILLYENKTLREKISEKGYLLFKKEFSNVHIGLQMKKIIEKLY